MNQKQFEKKQKGTIMKRKLTSTSIVLTLTVLSVFGVASARQHTLHSDHGNVALHSERTGNWDVGYTIHDGGRCCDLNAGGGSNALHNNQ